MSIYLDSAYIAKCYLNEPDAPKVRALLRGKPGLTSSAFCVAEMACIFQRHVREGGLTRAQAARLRGFFRADVGAGVWALLPITQPLLDEVDRRVRALPRTVYLRAGDAIHLTAARAEGFAEIWSNDRHMLAAASHFGIVGKSV